MSDTPKPCSIAPQVNLAAIGAASADLRAEAFRMCLLAEGAIRWNREGHAYGPFPRSSAVTSLPIPSDGIDEQQAKPAADLTAA